MIYSRLLIDRQSYGFSYEEHRIRFALGGETVQIVSLTNRRHHPESPAS